jgi:hypothetical protein
MKLALLAYLDPRGALGASGPHPAGHTTSPPAVHLLSMLSEGLLPTGASRHPSGIPLSCSSEAVPVLLKVALEVATAYPEASGPMIQAGWIPEILGSDLPSVHRRTSTLARQLLLHLCTHDVPGLPDSQVRSAASATAVTSMTVGATAHPASFPLSPFPTSPSQPTSPAPTPGSVPVGTPPGGLTGPQSALLPGARRQLAQWLGSSLPASVTAAHPGSNWVGLQQQVALLVEAATAELGWARKLVPGLVTGDAQAARQQARVLESHACGVFTGLVLDLLASSTSQTSTSHPPHGAAVAHSVVLPLLQLLKTAARTHMPELLMLAGIHAGSLATEAAAKSRQQDSSAGVSEAAAGAAVTPEPGVKQALGEQGAKHPPSPMQPTKSGKLHAADKAGGWKSDVAADLSGLRPAKHGETAAPSAASLGNRQQPQSQAGHPASRILRPSAQHGPGYAALAAAAGAASPTSGSRQPGKTGAPVIAAGNKASSHHPQSHSAQEEVLHHHQGDTTTPTKPPSGRSSSASSTEATQGNSGSSEILPESHDPLLLGPQLVLQVMESLTLHPLHAGVREAAVQLAVLMHEQLLKATTRAATATEAEPQPRAEGATGSGAADPSTSMTDASSTGGAGNTGSSNPRRMWPTARQGGPHTGESRALAPSLRRAPTPGAASGQDRSAHLLHLLPRLVGLMQGAVRAGEAGDEYWGVINKVREVTVCQSGACLALSACLITVEIWQATRTWCVTAATRPQTVYTFLLLLCLQDCLPAAAAAKAYHVLALTLSQVMALLSWTVTALLQHESSSVVPGTPAPVGISVSGEGHQQQHVYGLATGACHLVAVLGRLLEYSEMQGLLLGSGNSQALLRAGHQALAAALDGINPALHPTPCCQPGASEADASQATSWLAQLVWCHAGLQVGGVGGPLPVMQLPVNEEGRVPLLV